MKKTLSFLLYFFVLFSFAQNNPTAEDVVRDAQRKVDLVEVQTQQEIDGNIQQTERILFYNVDIFVEKEASLVVTETIKVNSNGDQISRGIFRSFPKKRNLNQETYPIKYKIISIKKDGNEDSHHEETDDEWYKIYIGDKDVFLQPGQYTYEIKYRVQKQIGFFDSYDELYWNVTGTEWSFPIDRVLATVHLPEGANIIQNSCYTGPFGSKDSNCEGTKINDTTFAWNATTLNSNEGLTIAVGFKKGVVLPPPPPSFLELYGIPIFLLLAFAFLANMCYTLWKKYGIDPQKPVVIPQFNAPDNLSPAAIGFLYHEKIKDTSLTASLTHLAIKGFISIEEIEIKKYLGISTTKGYKLSKLKSENETLPPEEQILMELLFSKGETITIDGKYKTNVEDAAMTYDVSIRDQFQHIFKEGQNLKYLIKPALIFLALFIISFVAANMIEGRTETLNFGIMMVFGLGVPGLFYYLLQRKTQTTANGCVKILFAIIFGFNVIATFFTVIVSALNSGNGQNVISCFAFFIAGIVGLIFMQYLIKKPTVEKLKIKAEIEGFKMYMGAAENEQIKFHNAPKITPEIFEKHLPYAMIFGVEKIWGQKFEAMLATMTTAYDSSWYVGNSFSPSTFGSTLNSQLTNSFASSSNNPASSSSGGSSSSGSSGGGSSGGGGGGGGGGGW